MPDEKKQDNQIYDVFCDDSAYLNSSFQPPVITESDIKHIIEKEKEFFDEVDKKMGLSY